MVATMFVSILVVMDSHKELSFTDILIIDLTCFNPCCNGFT